MSDAEIAAALVRDWVEYRAGRLDTDISHFQTLFHCDHDRASLGLVFEGLPNAGQLVLRAERCRAAHRNWAARERVLTSSRALAIAERDLADVAAILEDAEQHELLDIVRRVRPVPCNDRALFDSSREADSPSGWLHDELGDHWSELWLDIGSIKHALHEAFYGIANDYHVARYMEAPLMRTDRSFEPALLLWEAGYQTALTLDAYLVHGRWS